MTITAKTTSLLLTPGEPGGVGCEISMKAWQGLRNQTEHRFALITDEDYLCQVAQVSGVSCPIVRIDHMAQAARVFASALPILHRPLPATAVLGQFTAATASWVTQAITEAVDLCLAGSAKAMVTNPIQKQALYAAGFAYQGHTDFLAALSLERGYEAQDVMMLVGGGLRAVPLTVHIALKDVAKTLSQEMIETQAIVVDAALRKHFGISNPRIAITGLNPHAGENGSMGREEIDIIRPAIAALQARGVGVFGPLPADTAFFPQARDNYDVILCMYHDQALIPVKTLDFHGGVNVTLGLPFIRTSPDHGTALDLAGSGKAQAESLIAAIKLAARMAGT
jgi:4-hydroxythreonine-4-phosphate dehydrogenase